MRSEAIEAAGIGLKDEERALDGVQRGEGLGQDVCGSVREVALGRGRRAKVSERLQDAEQPDEVVIAIHHFREGHARALQM